MKDKFNGKDCEINRNSTLDHMKNLWHKWRGSLMQGYIKPTKSKECAWQKVPKSVSPEDWKWLPDEHFFNDDFLVCWLRLHLTLCAIFLLFFRLLLPVIMAIIL